MGLKLKVAGARSGLLEVVPVTWTVQMLRVEMAHRSNSCDPTRINLISGGKVLKDGDSTLLQLGLKNNGKVLATLTADSGKTKEIEEKAMKAKDEEEHAKKLTRIW